jgi:hypothetical protein
MVFVVDMITLWYFAVGLFPYIDMSTNWFWLSGFVRNVAEIIAIPLSFLVEVNAVNNDKLTCWCMNVFLTPKMLL